jgi:hypothetical protein
MMICMESGTYTELCSQSLMSGVATTADRITRAIKR